MFDLYDTLTMQNRATSSSHLLLYLVLSVQRSFHCIKELFLVDQTVGPLLRTGNTKHMLICGNSSVQEAE